MESLSLWLAENASAVWATIIAFCSANFVAIVGFVIGAIRARLNAIKASENATEAQKKLVAGFQEYLDDMEDKIIEACNVNTKERIEAMQRIADSVNATNEALKEIPVEEVAETNVLDALNKLD